MFFVCVYRHNCILYCWTWVLILHKTTVYFQSVFSQLTMNFSLAINGYARWFGEKQKKGSRKRKGLKSTEVNGNMSNDVQITTKNSNAQIPSTRTRTIHNRYYVQVFFSHLIFIYFDGCGTRQGIHKSVLFSMAHLNGGITRSSTLWRFL